MHSEAVKPNSVVKRGLPAFLYSMIGVLGLAAIFMWSGRTDSRIHASIASTAPGGLAAYGELLRQAGWKVVSVKPRALAPNSGDLVIVPLERTEQSPQLRGDVDSGDFVARVRAMRLRGVNVMAVSFSYELTLDRSDDLGQRAGLVGQDREFVVTPWDQGSSTTPWTALSDESRSYSFEVVYPLHREYLDAPVFVDLSLPGVVVVSDLGDPLLNRYIDRVDNAQLGYELVRKFTRPGATIWFVENTDVGSRDNFWADVGSWGPVFYWQSILFIGVVVYSLGRRFGPPIEYKRIAAGGRELVDAVGNLMWRARKTDMALGYLAENLDLRVRRALNVSLQASRDQRDMRVPAEVLEPLAALERGVSQRWSLNDARVLAKNALAAVESLEASMKTGRRTVV